MPAQRKTAPNISAIARQHGVSRQTLGTWRDQGLDLSDDKAVAAKVSAMHSNSGGSITEARLEKLKAETARINHALDVERGKFISAQIVEADGRSIGVLVRSAHAKAAQNWPPMLAGRTAAECSTILKRLFREMQQELAQFKSSISL
jgi:transposase-like protein